MLDNISTNNLSIEVQKFRFLDLFFTHIQAIYVGFRDGNLDPIHGYLTRPDTNGSDFTWPNKLQGWVWIKKNKKKNPKVGLSRVRVFPKTRPEP